MGDSYQVVVKKVKKYLRDNYPDIKIVEEGSLLYFDIGFGEKFVIFTLPVGKYFSLDSLVGFMSTEVFLETVRRFIEIKPPKGYRVRFLVFSNYDGNFENLDKHLTVLGIDRVLLLVNTQELGLGNEKIVINGIDGKLLFKVSRILKENGLNTGMLQARHQTMSDKIKNINILEFYSFPNPYKGVMPKDVYDTKRRDFGVTMSILLLDSVIRT